MWMKLNFEFELIAMNILLLGAGGGNMHWPENQPPALFKTFIGPGIPERHQWQHVDLSPTDFESIKKFCLSNKIDYCGRTQEPLVNGSRLCPGSSLKYFRHRSNGRAHNSKAARHFPKKFMRKYNTPTAATGNLTSRMRKELLTC
jgi:hypothetical protein